MILIKEILILAVLYYWLLAVCDAETVRIRPCKIFGGLTAKTKINEVRIHPCPSGEPCEIFKKTNATITVKFTPDEVPSSSTSCKLKSSLVWVSKIDMGFGKVRQDACEKYIKCPLRANEENVFNVTFYISETWPISSYPLKLRLYEEQGAKKRVHVCQLFKIKLVDQIADDVLS